MIFPVKYLPVNWIDGMKVSKDHFIDTDKHHHDAVRDVASLPLTNYNFGLLPTSKDIRSEFNLSVSENIGSSITLKLSQCNAITPGGCRIYITKEYSDNGIPLSATIKNNGSDTKSNNEITWFDVVIVVNPFERVPAGYPDPEENPLRHPFTDSKYSLQIIPSDQIKNSDLGAYFLVVGKLKLKGDTFSDLENYIPPSSSVQSHPALIAYYENFGSAIEFMHGTSIKIIQKIFEKNKPSSIAKNYKLLCEKLLDYTANIFFQFRNTLPQSAPVYLAGSISSMANVIYTTLYCIPSEEREELLKYIFEWCDITPNAFEEELLKAAEVKYNHYNIVESMDSLTTFFRTLTIVWTKMNNLEFIGQRKENIVVKKEVVQPQVEQPKKRWSIID